jgi:dihydropteroate synthase
MDQKDNFFSKKRTINFKGNMVAMETPVVMGIINLTPDSFYKGSRFSINEILKRIEKMISEGVRIIDIGAVSTRPGSENISEIEELNRLTPSLTTIQKEFPEIILSLDTYHSKVARIAVENYNVRLINDISAGKFDELMFETIAALKVPYIMMHVAGNMQTMHKKHDYNNIIIEMIQYFAKKIELAHQFGIYDIIIDPGFGFSKTLENNYHILAHLDKFRIFELPVIVGLSRKSMTYKLLNITPDEALNTTTVVNTLALLKGADILRVHDVKEATEAIKIVQQLKEN